MKTYEERFSTKHAPHGLRLLGVDRRRYQQGLRGLLERHQDGPGPPVQLRAARRPHPRGPADPPRLREPPLRAGPEHLKAVTPSENMPSSISTTAYAHAIKTHCPKGHCPKGHCPKGHRYDKANTYRTPNGSRSCKLCRAAWQREFRASR